LKTKKTMILKKTVFTVSTILLAVMSYNPKADEAGSEYNQFHRCEVKNSDGTINHEGNTCDKGGRLCKANPCKK